MKYRLLTLSTMLYTSCYFVNAQDNQVRTFGYNYYGQRINEKAICNMMSFRSKKIAEKSVEEIVRRSGLKKNFYVMECPNTDNCFAAIKGQTRIIVYDGVFMRKANNMAQSDWGALSILAHEIGHHLQGHTIIEGGSDPQKELEADEFSGFVMYQMGASLKDAQAAISRFTSDYDGGTHPSRNRRLAAIEKGFRNAQELYPSVKKMDENILANISKRAKDGEIVDNVDKNVNNSATVAIQDNSIRHLGAEMSRPEPRNVDNLSTIVKNPACFDGDCNNGFGKMVNTKTMERYEGEWSNGKRQGRGIEYYSDGQRKYVGYLMYGKYHGYGTFYFKNGDKYVGKYKAGLMNDERGYFIYNNNIRLIVKVENNKKTGKAVRLFPDGRKELTYFNNNLERKEYMEN